MVKAGAPVDAVINQLVPLLEKGDVIIDGGNSLFTDTQRRCKDLEGRGLHFVGCGVSGGEEGALKGPSLMPGGSRESWEIIAPIFTQDRGDRGRRTVLPLHGPGRRRPLREDGAQRHRVRRHAAHLRSLRDPERRRGSGAPKSWPRFSPNGTKAISTAISSRSPRRSFARSIPIPASRWSMSSSTRPDRKAPACGPCSRRSASPSSSPRSTPRSKRASFPRGKTNASRPRKFCRSRRCRSLPAIAMS